MKLTPEEIEEKVSRDKVSLDLSGSLFTQRKLTNADIPLLCQYLNDHPNIKRLNFIFNSIGVKGAQALAANVTLTMLSVRHNDIGVEGAKALAANRTWTTLIAEQNYICDRGAKALAANTTLTTLNVAQNRIREEGAKALAANTTLRTLNLSFNDIKDAGAIALAANNTLTTLVMRQCGIGEAGAKALAANATLTTLDLWGNEIGVEGAQALARNTVLTRLNIVSNCISASLQTRIENLILKRNKIKPWLTVMNYARFMSQAQRSENCPLGALPIEVLGIISNYAIAANYSAFFNNQFDKRPTAEDLILAKKMAQL